MFAKSKRKFTFENIIFKILFLIGILLFLITLFSKNDMIFSVIIAISYYLLCNIFIRNTFKDDEKEISNDILDSSIVAISIMYVLKTLIDNHFYNGDAKFGTLTLFLFYAFTLGTGIAIVGICFIIGRFRNTHWSAPKKERLQFDMDLLEQSILKEKIQIDMDLLEQNILIESPQKRK